MTSQRTEYQAMANTPDLSGVYEKLGEMTATLREVSHTGRNNAQKIDALAEVVLKQGLIHEKVDLLTSNMGEHHKRIVILEIEKHHRDGAIGLFEWASKHWPFLLFGTGLFVWVGVANEVFGK